MEVKNSSHTCGVDANDQSSSDPSAAVNSAGMNTLGSLLASPPASITATVVDGFSERRFARTRPAVPPPMMIKSYDVPNVILMACSGRRVVRYEMARVRLLQMLW